MATAGTLELEIRAHVDPALDALDLVYLQLDRHYTRRDRFVMWVARQLGVDIYVRRPKGPESDLGRVELSE